MAVAILGVMLRIVLPLVVIVGIAVFVLNYRSLGSGSIRVTTSVPGADIFLGGTMTGLQSDTTLLNVPPGRSIITVRKAGFVSDPEVIVTEVGKGHVIRANFVLRNEQTQARMDSIPPLRNVRQEIFSTGEPVRSVPASQYRRGQRFLDFAPQSTSAEPRSAESSSAQTQTPVTYEQPTTESPIQNAQVTVSSVPENAQVIVNGTMTPRMTPYTFQNLEAGMYVIKLLKAGYSVKPESITVVLREDYQSELAAFELAPDADLPKPTLTVMTTPPAAGIKVNGKSVGVGKIILDAAYGTQSIEFVAAPGYRTPAPVQVELTADQPHQEITGTYEKISGNAYIAVMPGEDLGSEFESGKLRVFVDNELILDNSKEHFDVTLMGKILSGKRLVRIQYGELADDIHVNLTDNEVSEITFRIESFFSKRRLRLRDKDPIPMDKWEQKSRRLTVLNAS